MGRDSVLTPPILQQGLGGGWSQRGLHVGREEGTGGGGRS